MTEEYIVKINFIGSGSVGKTSIIRRYAEGKFTKNYLPTLGIDITTKTTILTDRVGAFIVKIIFADTAGQSFFSNLRPAYYRGSNGCVIVFALNDPESFGSIPHFFDEFVKHVPDEDVPRILVGNKLDLHLERNVNDEEIEKLCKEKNLTYFETSALTGYNIETMIKFILQKIFDTRSEFKKKPISFEKQSDISPNQKQYLNGIKQFKNWDEVKINDFLNKTFECINKIEITEDTHVSSFLVQLSELIIQSSKNQLSPRTRAILFANLAKATILIALTKKLEGSLEVFLDLYIEGLKNYSHTAQLIDLGTSENAYWLNQILSDIFLFYSRMISEPIDIDRVQQVLETHSEIRAIGLEYGDRFFIFFEQCLIVRSSRTLEEYKDLKRTLEYIQSIFDKDNPHRQLVIKTYQILLNFIPPVLIAEKKILPDPPQYSENALVILKLVSRVDKKLQARLDIKSSSNTEVLKQIISLNPLEVREVSLQLGKIESSSVYIRVDVLLRKGKSYKTIYHDSIQRDVGGEKPLIVHVQAPKGQEKFSKYNKLDLSLFIFNTENKLRNTQLIVERSWDSDLQRFPSKKIGPKEMGELDLSLKVPKLEGTQHIMFRFLDINGVEIPNSLHTVEFIIENTKKGRVLRFLKGVGRIGIEAGKVIIS